MTTKSRAKLSELRLKLVLLNCFSTNDMKLIEGVTLKTMRDLWTMRFGDEWVDLNAVGEAGSFYRSALFNLEANSQVEALYLMSENKTVVKLKPTES